MATTILLVRHGETDWNREHRFQGHADVPLNEKGVAQVEALSGRLAGEELDAVYTSPLRRAAESAEILAGRLRLEARPSPALMEIDVGSWSGLTVDEISARFPAGFRRWADWRTTGWDDGETYEELGSRVVAGLHEIGRAHPGGHVLAVTHGGPIRAALAAAADLPFDEVHGRFGAFENCALFRIAVDEGRIELAD